jgi:hypothetical protein
MTFLVVQAFIAEGTTPAFSEPHGSMVASIAGKAPTILPPDITTNNYTDLSPGLFVLRIFNKNIPLILITEFIEEVLILHFPGTQPS